MPEPLNVLLGVSGGIAAFKVPEIVRTLRGRGHRVRCAMTRSAGAFVTPLTLEVLTEHLLATSEPGLPEPIREHDHPIVVLFSG